MWVPGHTGVVGNEMVGRLANGLHEAIISLPIPSGDQLAAI